MGFFLKEAVDEVFNEVFSQPIRPDFAIVYIGMEFSLPLTSLFVSHPSHFDFGLLAHCKSSQSQLNLLVFFGNLLLVLIIGYGV